MENIISIAHLTAFLGLLALAAWVGGISWGVDRGLLYWAATLACLSLLYGLMSLRTPLGRVMVALGNVLLASILAWLAECVRVWMGSTMWRGWLWLPVLVAALGFGFLNQGSGHTLLGLVVFGSQSVLILILTLQAPALARAMGFKLVALASAACAGLFALRAWADLTGRLSQWHLLDSGDIQANTLVLFLIVSMLVVVGFELISDKADASSR